MTIRTVTSLQNETVKFLRSLEMRKVRRETGLFTAEGVKVLGAARDLGWVPRVLLYDATEARTVFFRELIAWASEAGADCLEASAEVLGKLSTRDNPQNAIATFQQRWLEPGDICAGLWVVLEQVRDPGNLGTIIRTADAVGAAGVILVGDCCDPYAREAVRASMGSVFAVRLARLDLEDFARLAAGWQGEIVGTHLAATHDYRRAYASSAMLMMGSEGPGLSESMAKTCTHLVKIPMKGSADSLNLAVATGLMLYQMSDVR